MTLTKVIYHEVAERALTNGPIADRLEEFGEDVARGARSRVAVRTGRLLGSIRVETPPEPLGDKQFAVDVPADATNAGFPYAVALEYGTRYMTEDPFLIPALEEIEDG